MMFFSLVINFLGSDWQPKDVIIGLFEVTKSTSQTLAKILMKLLNKYDLRKKIIVYVKDEGSNFNAMTTILKIVVNYEYFGLKENF